MTRGDVIIEMSKLGWKKNLVFPWVSVNGRTGEVHKVIYQFNADSLICSNRRCQQYRLSFVQFKPHGVVWSCAICRRAEGPVVWESGTRMNGPLGETITPGEAWDILRQTGQAIPVGLKPLTGTEDLEIIG